MTQPLPTDQPRARRRLNFNWSKLARQGWYLLRILLLGLAMAVVSWIYGGDVYIAGAIVICGLIITAARIAPGLVPDPVRWLGMLPFALGALIPLWRIIGVIFRGDWPALQGLGILVIIYGLALAVLWWLPQTLRGPFLRWLPEHAIPADERPQPRAEGERRRGLFRRRGRQAEAASDSGASRASYSSGSSYGSSSYSYDDEDDAYAAPARSTAASAESDAKPRRGLPNPFKRTPKEAGSQSSPPRERRKLSLPNPFKRTPKEPGLPSSPPKERRKLSLPNPFKRQPKEASAQSSPPKERRKLNVPNPFKRGAKAGADQPREDDADYDVYSPGRYLDEDEDDDGSSGAGQSVSPFYGYDEDDFR